VIDLRQGEWRPLLSMLDVIFFDYIHQGSGITVIEHYLASASALQNLFVEFLDRWQTMLRRQLVELIQEIDRRLLILQRIFMLVITLGHGDAI
jgi:hypothetical protein